MFQSFHSNKLTEITQRRGEKNILFPLKEAFISTFDGQEALRLVTAQELCKNLGEVKHSEYIFLKCTFAKGCI